MVDRVATRRRWRLRWTHASLRPNRQFEQRLRLQPVSVLVIVMAAIQLALQLSLLARGVEYAAASLVIDDTYYYLQSAWNARHLGFVTFDGLHPTNGVQFLWFAFILVLAFLTQTKTALLFAALLLSFLFNGLCYLVILKIAAVLQRPALGLLMAALWALQSLPFRIYSTGMENSLHALVFWCVIWQSLEFLVRVRQGQTPHFWGLTFSIVLNVWTRLDAALLSAVVFVFCLTCLIYVQRRTGRRFIHDHAKPVTAASLAAGLALLIQVSAFQIMGGSLLPVSALVKTSGAGRGLTPAAVEKLVEVMALGMPSVIQGRLPTLGLVALGLAGILVLLAARARWPSRLAGVRPLADLWACLLLAEGLYHGYIAVSGVEYTPYFMWYRSPSFIFWILTVSLLLLLAIDLAQHTRFTRLPLHFAMWSTVGFSLASFGIAIYLFARSLNFASDLYAARFAAAHWIAEHLPAGTVFAAWNTGQLGYFSERTFINLDGVINSVDYYERILRDDGSLTDYLYENNVAYVVDYATYDSLPAFPVVHSFPLNDGTGRAINIWQLPSHIANAP